MKKYILILIVAISTNAFAQNPVIEIESWDGKMLPNGAYLKDANNRQSQYVGTWHYSENGKELTLVLKRYEMAFTGRTYNDILVGEYKYVVNGITVINTLPNLNNDLPNKWSHNISGSYPIGRLASPYCPECDPDEKRMAMGFFDPIREISGSLTLRRITVNGVAAIKMDLFAESEVVDENDTRSPEDFQLHVDISECVLLKIE
ncbi:hypothetical protein GV828_01380 [Flavobacterium sp. NST-5]|uniref:DUF6705 domain-containing protein n=1 Tax=Flavobacterium ichthyis TaxID=2698827 RepID=A0ABW9Z6V4_9FLAO|nr:DUF6705 family protein [Flavobacterium ichthyis]NBL63845.1 hypothetical protein [Flavobacterium ichthyis]